MNVMVEPALAAHCNEVITVQGLGQSTYVCTLIARGIRQELLETYTKKSVDEYTSVLHSTGTSLWTLLKPKHLQQRKEKPDGSQADS